MSYGTASDTSSTAWVIWALNALNMSASSGVKSGHNPLDYLNSTQTSAGFFEYQTGSGEDSFTPVTTSYAVIALAGKKLPLKIISSTPAQEFDFRIEGANEQICAGKVPGPTALDIVKNASAVCGFTYHISDTSFGLYLDEINSDKASGLTGWIYLVDYTAPSVGAADYSLKSGDTVLWFYGDFDWLPARLSLSSTEITSGTVEATVEYFSNNTWLPLPDASVYFGTQIAITDANGQVSISPADGYYKVFASKSGFVRTNSVLLKVGEPPSASISLNLEVGNVMGATTIPPNTISFTVTPSSLDFGTLAPGEAAAKIVKISNTGTVGIHVESVVSGDQLYKDNLEIGLVPWRNFKTDIEKAANEDEVLKISVPAGYPGGSGSKSGQVTFWAAPQ